MKLTEEFLWGSSTSDFQYEGGLEKGNRGILAADYVTDGTNNNQRRITFQYPDGHISSVGIYESLPEGVKPAFDSIEYYPSHSAVDFEERWEEDIQNMKEMGLKAYRFSICWTRIFPTGVEEQPKEEGLIFYEKIINKLIESGIEPIITICHNEIPVYLAYHY